MKIAVAGGYGVGMTMRVAAAPSAGETVTGGALSVGHGGKGSNQAVAAARLGAEVSLFTAIGSDLHGDAAREFWAAEGVDASGVVTSDAATMVGFIIVDASGENRIAIAPGALNALTVDDVEGFRASIADAQLLVVSLEIPLDVALRLLEVAREVGTATVLNPAPATPIPATAWSTVDVVTPNSTEAAILLGVDEVEVQDAETTATRLAELSGATVVLTGGAAGAVIARDGSAVRIDPVRVAEVVDTTGAGDAFTAAFAVEFAAGADPAEAARFAAYAGAHAVTIPEVIPALATREQLDAFRSTLEKVKDQK